MTKACDPPEQNPKDAEIQKAFRGISDYQKTVKEMVRPIKEINSFSLNSDLAKSIGDNLNTFRQIHETLRRAFEPSEEMRRAVQAIQELQHSVDAVVKNISKNFIQFDNSLRKIQQPILEFQDTWKKVMEGSKVNLQNHVKEFHHFQLTIQNEVSLSFKPAIQFSEAFQRSLTHHSQLDFSHNRFSQLLKDIDWVVREIEKGVKVNSEGTIQADGTTFSVNEANQQLSEFLKNSQFISELPSGQRTLEEQLHWIIDKLQKAESPLRMILIHFIVPIIVAVCASTLTNNFSENPEFELKSRKEIIARLTKEATLFGLEKGDLKNIRFVTASALFVRENPKRRSRPIGKIYQGWLVRIVKFGRHWTLIEYSAGDVAIRGWVFSRYLGKLRHH